MSGLVKRSIAPVLRRYLQTFPAVLVEGARQVGKSTLVTQVAPDAVVLNLDLPHVRDAAHADPIGLLTQDTNRTVIIDEIQLLPSLTQTIKALIGQERRPGRFLLTGSASLLRMSGTQDSMAGRVARLNLFGFDQGERERTVADFVPALLSVTDLAGFRSGVRRDGYVQRCVAGSFPEACSLPLDLRDVWFDSYLTGIVHRDLLEIRRQVRPARVDALLRLLAAGQMGETVKAKLGLRSDIPASSVGTYLGLLQDVQLITSIRPWKPDLARRESGKAKTLVLDSGLAVRLAGVTGQQLANLTQPEAFGRFLEGLVASELLKQRTWSAAKFELYHYRDIDGSEVDLVVELSDGNVVGIEVKAASSFQARQFDGLVRLRDRLGDRFVAGIVLNTGTEGYRYAPRLWGLPVAALWELGDSSGADS